MAGSAKDSSGEAAGGRSWSIWWVLGPALCCLLAWAFDFSKFLYILDTFGGGMSVETAKAEYKKAREDAYKKANEAYDRSVASGASANVAMAAACAAGLPAVIVPPRVQKPIAESLACPMADHSADLGRPIMKVRADHPDESNLFCYFSKHVPWFQGAEVSNALQHYAMCPEQVRQVQWRFSPYVRPDGTGPLVTFHMEGLPPEGLTSHIDGQTYYFDDLYCYTLGFLQNQGLDAKLMFDFEGWKEAARQQCEKFAQEFNFTDQELTVQNHINNDEPIHDGVVCAGGHGPRNCKPTTRRELILRAYQRCLVGDEASEMAYCYARACLLGNHIGHFGECN